MEHFQSRLLERMELRNEEMDKWNSMDLKQDFADAAKQIEDAEQRKLEEAERIRIRREQEEERKRREEEERREAERKRVEAELEKIRKAKEEAQIAKDMKVVHIYLEEAQYFVQELAKRKQERFETDAMYKQAFEQLKIERQIRQAQKEEEQREAQGKKWRFDIR